MQALGSVLDTTLGLTTTALAKKTRPAHKRVHYREPLQPKNGKKFPNVIEAVKEQLVVALEQRRGSLFHRICLCVCVAGYTLAKSLNRSRRLRNDGAESLLAMVVALMYRADLKTGLIRTTRPSGHVERPDLGYLAELAYQGQSTKDLKRAQRSLKMLESLGLLYPVKESKVFCKESQTYRSYAAFRYLNWDRVCQMTGTSHLLKKWRAYLTHKQQQAHDAKIHRPSFKKRPQVLQESCAGQEEINPNGLPPPATAGPPKRLSAEELEQMRRELFD